MALASRSFDFDDQSQLSWLRLSFVGLPAGRCRAALQHWQTPQDLLNAAAQGHDEELLETRGITPISVTRLRDAASKNLQTALKSIEHFNLWLILDTDDDYPSALRVIPDPPPYLWVRGDITPQDEIAIGIVGTRNLTEYGRGLAGKLSGDLARRGVTVVSGLARGIDSAAHRGALDAGGRTFACCGCGLDISYPPENRGLTEEIVRNGAIISEFAPTVHPEPWHFPARNRIISGLSAGVVVVEANARSGALITADFALEQGREVFAVPGNVMKPQSRGPHGLIKQGAMLIENADDIFEALNNRTLPFETGAHARQVLADGGEQAPAPEKRTRRAKNAVSGSSSNQGALEFSEPQIASQVLAPASNKVQRSAPTEVRADLNASENRIYCALQWEARHIDDIAQSAQMSPGEASATLLMLELKNYARRLPGGMFERVS